jgi:hypothetical protein
MTPETMHDDVFGELFYDPPLDQWCGEVAVAPEHRIEVTIWWDKETDGLFAPILERARRTYTGFVRRERENRIALAVALLQRYRGCVPEDEEMPDVEGIARGLKVTGITIAADGSATAYYDDPAELFGDHLIWAELGTDGAFIDFSLQG